jgi:hypothetical protein
MELGAVGRATDAEGLMPAVVPVASKVAPPEG